MRSMTGYGSGRAVLGQGQVVLDVRTVNHRFLDVRVRLPSRIQSRTPTVERVIRARLERGRVDVTARFEGQTLPQPTLDLDRARAVYAELAALRDTLNPDEPLPLALLSSVPDLFVINRAIDEETLERSLEQAAAEACDAVIAMRDKEGNALASELCARLQELRASVDALKVAASIARRRPQDPPSRSPAGPTGRGRCRARPFAPGAGDRRAGGPLRRRRGARAAR